MSVYMITYFLSVTTGHSHEHDENCGCGGDHRRNGCGSSAEGSTETYVVVVVSRKKIWYGKTRDFHAAAGRRL